MSLNKTIRIIIPNIFTATNVLLGTFAIYYAFDGYSITAAYLIIIATFIDFLDGFVARLVNGQSDFGKQFDSLSDLISFGIAPAAILYNLFSRDVASPEIIVNEQNIIPFFAFLLVIFSATRLARFNTDSEQKTSFKGLPTPANALIIASIPLMMANMCKCTLLYQTLSDTYFLIGYIIIASIFMNINVRMLSLKFSNLKLKDNLFRYLLIITTLVSIVVIIFIYNLHFGFALASVMILYILFSLSELVICEKKT